MKLVEQRVIDFVAATASKEPTPGGGAIAALTAPTANVRFATISAKAAPVAAVSAAIAKGCAYSCYSTSLQRCGYGTF